MNTECKNCPFQGKVCNDFFACVGKCKSFYEWEAREYRKKHKDMQEALKQASKNGFKVTKK